MDTYIGMWVSVVNSKSFYRAGDYEYLTNASWVKRDWWYYLSTFQNMYDTDFDNLSLKLVTEVEGEFVVYHWCW